jgi:hypothetical protein
MYPHKKTTEDPMYCDYCNPWQNEFMQQDKKQEPTAVKVLLDSVSQ